MPEEATRPKTRMPRHIRLVVLSCCVLSGPLQSCLVLSCPVLCRFVMSCADLSCPVLSCPVLSGPVLSGFVIPNILCAHILLGTFGRLFSACAYSAPDLQLAKTSWTQLACGGRRVELYEKLITADVKAPSSLLHLLRTWVTHSWLTQDGLQFLQTPSTQLICTCRCVDLCDELITFVFAVKTQRSLLHL